MFISPPLLFLHISVGPRKIGFQEEVISSSKEVECPRGRVPNEVYVRNKSSSGKKTRGMASNKGVAVRILGPLEKEVRPNFSTTLGSARVTRRNDFRYPNIFFRGNRRPFSQVSCPSLSICETRTMEANLAPKKMADHVSLGMAGISCTLKIVCQGLMSGIRERSLVFVFRSGWPLFLLFFYTLEGFKIETSFRAIELNRKIMRKNYIEFSG